LAGTTARRLTVEFSTEDALRSEFASNIANGGIFVRSNESIELREAVLVEIKLDYCGEVVELEGEVVHSVPPEMASAGAQPGVAVQFRLSARELCSRMEPWVGDVGAVGSERATGAGRRAAPRATARVRAVVTTSDGRSVEGRTRDVSSSGLLVTLRSEAIPVGEAVCLTLSHPVSRERMEIKGTVVRHVQSNKGTVAAMAIEFQGSETRQAEIADFMTDVQVTEQTRRLGGITGPIAELGIESTLRMFGSSSPKGTLTLTSGGEEGFVSFEGGVLRITRLGPLSGQQALEEMLGWRDGSFEFHASIDDEEPTEDPIQVGAAIEAALGRSAGSESGAEEASALDPYPDPELNLEDLSDAVDADAGLVSVTHESEFVVVQAEADAARSDLSKTEEAVLDLALVGMRVGKMLEIIPEPEADVMGAIEGLLERGLMVSGGR